MAVRASVNRIRVSVNSAAIESMFMPGGDVWAWGRDTGYEINAVARATAPSRTGHLRSAHGMLQVPNGRTQVRTVVYNDADHARYVHDGTVGPIMSTRPGGMMIVDPAPRSWFTRPTAVHEVRGQRAQPWLREAMEDVLARRGIH